jgi:hypothetical protein
MSKLTALIGFIFWLYRLPGHRHPPLPLELLPALPRRGCRSNLAAV